MKLKGLLDGLLMEVGGESWQQVKLQAELIKAQKAGRPTSPINSALSASNGDFTAILNQLTPTQLPSPPTDSTDAAQLALYNQQLLSYINRLNAQQAARLQQMQAQMTQMLTLLQQPRNNANTAGNNSQYPAGSQLSNLSGVVNTKPDSLLLDASTN
jgi:hypothetical protein